MTVPHPPEHNEETELMCDNVLRKVSSRQARHPPCLTAAGAMHTQPTLTVHRALDGWQYVCRLLCCPGVL